MRMRWNQLLRAGAHASSIEVTYHSSSKAISHSPDQGAVGGFSGSTVVTTVIHEMKRVPFRGWCAAKRRGRRFVRSDPSDVVR